MAFAKIRVLFRLKRATQAETTRPQRAPEESERDVDLLERVAAGIALNKNPGR